MKGKRLLIVGAAVALAISGCASATRITRTNPLKTNPVSGNFTLLTGTIEEGDYVIYYGGKAMNTTTANNRLQYAEVAPLNDVISNPDESIVWHIAASGDYFTIYNAADGKYAVSTGTKNQATTSATADDKALWTITGTGSFEIVNKYNKANSINSNLRNNGTYGFACYATSTGGALSLYKKTNGGSTPTTATLESISLSGTYPTSFYVGDSFSHSGMTVTAFYDDESTQDVTSSAVFTGYDMSSAGNQTVTVSYSENGVTKTETYDITLSVEHGTTESDPLTVAQALAKIEPLASNGITSKVYYTIGYIVSITSPWNDGYHNLTFTLGDTTDATSIITAYRCKAVSDSEGLALAEGDQVVVEAQLQKYGNNNDPQFKNGTATCKVAGANHGQNVVTVINDVDAESDSYDVIDVLNSGANNQVIAKVTGVAENHYYSNNRDSFYLVDPDTNDAIVVFGAYTQVTFQKTGNIYSVKEKSDNVTDGVEGHMVTVYGTIGSYNNKGQLVDALVVDEDIACIATVSASVSVNDQEMGSATLSAYSVTYGTEITVSTSPNQGYKVQKVEIQRLTKTSVDNVPANNGEYKFNAQCGNVVSVTFEFDENAVVIPDDAVTLTSTDFDNSDLNATAGEQTFINDGLQFVVSNGVYDANQVRVYKGETITFTADNISFIQFTCTATGSNKYGPGCFAEQEGYVFESDGYTGTWVGDEESVAFTASSNQVRITQIIIAYTPAEINPPVVSPKDYINDTASIARLDGTENVTAGDTVDDIAFANCNLENSKPVNRVAVGQTIIEFNKATSATAPAYYTSGAAVRTYGGNTVVVKSAATFTSIVLDVDNLNGLQASEGELDENTWTGNPTNSVTFTNTNGTGQTAQIRFAGINVTYNEEVESVGSVKLQLGGSISKANWDAINNNSNWEITDYGVMMFRTSDPNKITSATPVQDAIDAGKQPSVYSKGSGTAPTEENGYYSFVATINITKVSNYNVIFCAAPYILVKDLTTDVETPYFLTETQKTVKDLAQSGDSDLSSAALSLLVSLANAQNN